MNGGDEDWKELRVRIEARYHAQLVAIKVLRAKTMTEAIQEALDHYFESVLPDLPARPSRTRIEGPARVTVTGADDPLSLDH